MTLNLLRSQVSKTLIYALSLFLSASALAGEPRFTPEVSAELRYFPDSPAYNNQMSGFQPSIILGGEGRWVSDDRKQRVKFEPFLRLDGRDSERTHGDIREFSYSHRFDDFDLFAGVGQIFWGVAESRNVVDVINQFDVVENSDESDKLGQPLLRIGKYFDFGRIEAYYLPYFRERTFPGRQGRQRTPLLIDTNAAQYERDGEEFAGDFALRYTRQWDAFDIGFHGFYGTNRNPFLQLNSSGTAFIPIYQRLAQTGFDLQWTQDEWLLKFEAIAARSGGDDYVALVGGYEYTFFGVTDSGMDLGVLTEYLYDSRDPNRTAFSLFEHDVFLGARLTWNDIADTELLGGSIVDVETGASFASVEFQKRLYENYLLEVEGQYLTARPDDLINFFDQDSTITLRLTRYF
jgi:hypothetical protein